MKIRSAAAKLCLIITLCLTLGDVILRVIAYFTGFDAHVGYFAPSPLATALWILHVAVVLAAIILSLLVPSDALPRSWPRPGKDLSPLLPFALFAAGGIWILYVALTDHRSGKLLIAVGLLALLSAVYYLTLLLTPSGKGVSSASAALGFIPVFCGLLSVAETYTDQFTTMNAPVKLSLQFGFLGLMLLTTAELRFRLDKPAPRAALCFHCVALFFCLSASIPTLSALSAGILTRPVHGAYAMMLLGSGIYAAWRLALYFFLLPTPPESAASNTESPVSSEPVNSDPTTME